MIDESLRYLIVFCGALIIISVFLLSPIRSVMYIIAFQKVIDILWFIKINIGGFQLNLQRVVYAALPFILLPIIFYESRLKRIPMQMPIVKVFMILFVTWFIFGALRGQEEVEYTIELFFKLISGLTMFAIGWFYLDDEEKYDEFAKLFIFTYLISFLGVALQFFGIFQLADIGISQQTESGTGVEELIGAERTKRYAGFYNDGGTSAMYTFTTLPLCLYFIYKKEKHRWLYLTFFAIGLAGVILSFVRGTWLTVGLILLAWLFINREYGKIALATGSVALLISVGTFLGDFLRYFFRDLTATIEAGKPVGISGKGMRIEIAMESFYRQDFFTKLIGGGIGSTSKAVSLVTGNLKEFLETDFVTYLHDLGIIGWLLYYAIPTISLFLVWKHIRTCESSSLYSESLALKYKVTFAMLIGSFMAYFGSGTKWVSFTFPLWFLTGFALKHPAFYMLKRYEQEDNVTFIAPKLATDFR
ncbi:MAG: hypothetical protein ACUVRP_08700 [Chlorobiales bacterium]